MNIFKNLFKQKEVDLTGVVATIDLSGNNFGEKEERSAMYALRGGLEKAITENNVGIYDGHEVGEGQAILYMYGPNPSSLFKAVEPILNQSVLKPIKIELQDKLGNVTKELKIS